MGFPSQVNTVQAPAVAGNFASANPRFSVLAGPNALTAAASGVVVGRFAWADANFLTASNVAPTTGAPTGFVGRHMQALITTFLADNSRVIPQGQMVTLYSGGDFWATNNSASASVIGQKVYVDYASGQVTKFAATGSPTTNALITANTTSGSATLTVTANTGAAIAIGQPISGTGIAAGAYISAFGTGTGGAGTYTMSANATATGTGVTITATTNAETKWYAMSVGAANELVKISDHALG